MCSVETQTVQCAFVFSILCTEHICEWSQQDISHMNTRTHIQSHTHKLQGIERALLR